MNTSLTSLDLFLRNSAQLLQFQGFFLIFRLSSSLADTLLLPARDYQYGINEFFECQTAEGRYTNLRLVSVSQESFELSCHRVTAPSDDMDLRTGVHFKLLVSPYNMLPFILQPIQWPPGLLLCVVFLSDLEDPTPQTLDYTARRVGSRPINLLGLSWTVCSCSVCVTD